MLKKLISITIIVLSLVSYAGAKSSEYINKIVLLPLEQSNIRDSLKLSDARLFDAVTVQLTRLKNFELVGFAEFSKAYDKQFIDDAVFEILVTDDLDYTLDRLDCLGTKSSRLTEYCKVGKDEGIDYLVDVSVQQDLTQLRVIYRIMDTKAGRVVVAESFYDVQGDPIGTSDEIAKRVVRSLWQLKNGG